ncbi:MAG TPA: hypothetical protein VGW10_14880, partial [Solirubrobacteraceae bacterium]|nr:hypothetical protein [Solirubrobacteraceae bacterium]
QARRDGAVAPAVIALCAVIAVSAVPLFLASRYRDRAVEQAPAAPLAALSDLDRAQALDPLSPRPSTEEGLVALRLGQRARAVAAFEEALDRNADGWLPHLMLGLLAAREGDERAARAHLDAAGRLNPRERVVAKARTDVQAGRAADPLDIAAMVLRERE